MLHAREDYNGRIVDLDEPDGGIPIDEPVFLLRGQDVFAPRLLLAYAALVEDQGVDQRVADATRTHVQKMLDWQQDHKKKHADLPGAIVAPVKIEKADGE